MKKLDPKFDDSIFKQNGAGELTPEDLKQEVQKHLNPKGQSVPLCDIETKQIQWLHPGRIPIGKITVLAGDPDVGKTFLTLDVAARVSTGNRWPDGADNKAGKVIILSAEDDLSDTIVPRLEAAEANLDNIFALQSVTRYDPKEETTIEAIPTLIEDFEAVEREISIHKPRLLIIDPINAYLPGIDTHRDADLRTKVFAPLKRLAESYGVAVICVMHLNKSSSQSAKHRVSGSIAYVAASRATWLITSDKDDSSRKLMISVKFNIGPKPDGLAYKIIQNEEGQPVIAWEKDPIDVDPDEALKGDNTTAPERAAAIEFLKEILKDGPVSSEQIWKEANSEKISESTLRRAKSKLDISVDAVRVSGKPGVDHWVWKLPQK